MDSVRLAGQIEMGLWELASRMCLVWILNLKGGEKKNEEED